jgi:cholesterol transport system auxiliary component
MRALLLGVLVCAALPGCALLGKSDPVLSHYYTPEYDGAVSATPARTGPRLRLGRVEGWSHLRERMVLRSADGELSYAEARRWTERPEVYLRRALVRTLFEERGVVETHSGNVVTLEVELIAFEELERPHRVRLQAGVALQDHRTSLLRETITVEEPVAGPGEPGRVQAVIDAYGRALRACVSRIADRVVPTLSLEAAGTDR